MRLWDDSVSRNAFGMLFTDFYDNLEVRYFYVGNSMIYVTFIGIGVNSMIVVFKFATQLIRSWKKRRERKMKINKAQTKNLFHSFIFSVGGLKSI